MDKTNGAEGHESGLWETKPVAQDSLDLFEILLILSDARKRVTIITLCAAIVGIALSFALKPTFTATAMIMPPQQPQSGTAMLNQIGSLASLATGGSPLKATADNFVGILGSRTIADNVIAKFHLQSVYDCRTVEDTRRDLKAHTRFLATTDGLIHILVEDHSAKRASDIANEYVDQLHKMNSHLAITEAAQRRLFFDEELENERAALAHAEEDLRQSAEKNGVVQLPAQAESVIRSIAQLRAEIAAQEVRIQSLSTFATEENPQVVRARQEASALREQLSKLERDPRNTSSGSPDFSAGDVPGLSLEYSRKYRELKYHETLFELLSKQYEAARIDEAKAAPVIQVVDLAVPPDKKSAPSRWILTLGSAAIGFIVGCVVALLGQTLRKIQRIPAYASKLARLRVAMHRTPRVEEASVQ